MENYFVRRSSIALNHRKIWLILPILITIIFAFWLIVESPNVYTITSHYTPHKSVEWDQISSDEASANIQLWGDILKAMPLGIQFINSRVRKISRSNKISIAWAADPRNETSTRNSRRMFVPHIVRDIKEHLFMQVTSDDEGQSISQIEFSYNGTYKKMGEILIKSYSAAMLKDWRKRYLENLKREQYFLSRLLSPEFEAERKETSKTIGLLSPINKNIADRKIKIKTINNKIFLLSGTFSDPEIVNFETKLSDYFVTQIFLFWIICSFVLVLLILAEEFFSNFFTTEMQVSQYLGIRLIGTMNKIESIKDTEN